MGLGNRCGNHDVAEGLVTGKLIFEALTRLGRPRKLQRAIALLRRIGIGRRRPHPEFQRIAPRPLVALATDTRDAQEVVAGRQVEPLAARLETRLPAQHRRERFVAREFEHVRACVGRIGPA